jgi:hypothetical protein
MFNIHLKDETNTPNEILSNVKILLSNLDDVKSSSFEKNTEQQIKESYIYEQLRKISEKIKHLHPHHGELENVYILINGKLPDQTIQIEKLPVYCDKHRLFSKKTYNPETIAFVKQLMNYNDMKNSPLVNHNDKDSLKRVLKQLGDRDYYRTKHFTLSTESQCENCYSIIFKDVLQLFLELCTEHIVDRIRKVKQLFNDNKISSENANEIISVFSKHFETIAEYLTKYEGHKKVDREKFLVIIENCYRIMNSVDNVITEQFYKTLKIKEAINNKNLG